MMPIEDAAAEFLAHRRVAVAGVSASKPNAANGIYKRLRAEGYKVFAINPNADAVEGDVCYRSLSSLPVDVDGVIVGTHPAQSIDVARDCIAAGIQRIWFHHTFGAGSYSTEAVALCEAAGLAVIAGGCPMMHLSRIDRPHRWFKWYFNKKGKLPHTCKYEVPEVEGVWPNRAEPNLPD
jgi:predicted CoA-binding protein